MKLCTVCGVVTSRGGIRCTTHARQSARSRHNALYSTRAWQRLSARVLRAPWRSDPPVSDDLWARVEEVRRAKTRAGGPRHRGRRDMLAGLLECSCGRLIRSDGRMGNTERVAKLHTDPCAGWGTKARISASTWEVPVMTQLGSLRLDNSVRAQIVAVLSAGEQPVSMAATTTQLVWMLAGRLPETHSGERRSPTRTSRGEQGDFERTSKRRIDRAP